MALKTLAVSGVLIVASVPCAAQQSPDILPGWDVDQAPRHGLQGGDWNGDGRTDLVAYSELDGEHTVTVYTQRPDGRLQPGLSFPLPFDGPRRRLHAVRDLDGDGVAELVFMPGRNQLEAIAIVPRDGDGIPANIAINVGPVSNWTALTYTGPDASGRWDLLAFSGIAHTTHSNGEVWTIKQTASLSFAASQTGSSSLFPFAENTLFAKIDDDAYPDLLVYGENATNDPEFIIQFGDAANTYSTSMELLILDQYEKPVAVADIDGNGLPDIVRAADTVSILYQTAPLTFSATQLPIEGGNYAFRDARVADIDGDGDLDILGFGEYPGFQYRQTAGGTFLAVEQVNFIRYGFSTDADQTIVTDLNDDGYIDIATGSETVRIGYNSHGTYPFTDASLAVSATDEIRSDGTLVDYRFTMRNTGPDGTDSGELSAILQPDMRFVSSSDPCTVYAYAGDARIVCPVANLAAGAQHALTIQAKTVATSAQTSVSASIKAEYLTPDRLDVDGTNNLAELEHNVAPGHAIHYGGLYDHVFAAEDSQQLPVVALRETTGIGNSFLTLALTHITTDAGDLEGPFYQVISWFDGDTGPSRTLIPIVADDIPEGSEQFRITIPGLGDTIPGFPVSPMVATIFDNRPDLTKSGIRLTEPSADYIESERVLSFAESPDEIVTVPAMAIGDINGDGQDDFVALTQKEVIGSDAPMASLLVYAATIKGELAPEPVTIPLGESACCLAVGDINGDQLADVVVGTASGVQFFLQSTLHDLQFDHQQDGRPPSAVLMNDLDGDGRNDLVVTVDGAFQSVYDGTMDVYHQAETGQLVQSFHWTGERGATYSTVTLGDIDQDELIDIAVAQSVASKAPISLFLQTVDGEFSPPVVRSPRGPGTDESPEVLQIVDADRDGDMELMFPRFVYDFADETLGEGVRQLWDTSQYVFASADVDGNGILDDFFWLQSSQAPALRRWIDADHYETLYPGNEWDGLFIATPDDLRYSIGDIGSDGMVDIAIADERNPQVMILSAFPQQSQMLLEVITEPGDILQGNADEMVVRVSNVASRGSPEAVLGISTTDELALDSLLPAAGSCSIRQQVSTEAECTVPSLDAGGHVDIAIGWTGSAPGRGSVSASLAMRFGTTAPGQVEATRTVVVAENPNPPPPPPPSGQPPPQNGGGGGGGTSGWLLLLALSIASQFRARRNSGTVTLCPGNQGHCVRIACAW